jgi:hypothetical protein
MQQDIFGGEAPMAASEPDVAPEPVPKSPGWYLVASRSAGPTFWHLLASAGASGTVVTRCGVRGHVVADAARTMTCCPECTAALG